MCSAVGVAHVVLGLVLGHACNTVCWRCVYVQVNKQGMKLQCSHYFPLDAKSQDGKLPVVVYCHCNSGSRRDAEEAVYHLLPCGVGVVAFDFTVSAAQHVRCLCQLCAVGSSTRTAVQGCLAHGVPRSR